MSTIFLFKMKFAVDRSLEGRRYETDPIGPSLKRVLRYWTVRNKFEETRIHPDLKKIGVTSIIVLFGCYYSNSSNSIQIVY